MSEAAHDLTQAEVFGLRAHSAPLEGSEGELFLREAHRNGRRIAVMRCVRRGADVVVECSVEPQEAVAGSPPRRLSYLFPDDQEARRFVDETALALVYLGCEVN